MNITSFLQTGFLLCLLVISKSIFAIDFFELEEIKKDDDMCGSSFLSAKTHREVISVTVRSPRWPYIRNQIGIFVGDGHTVTVPLHVAFPLRKADKLLKYSFKDPNTGESLPLEPFAADLRSDLMLLATSKKYQSESFYPIERLVKEEQMQGLEEILILGFSQGQRNIIRGRISSYQGPINDRFVSVIVPENKVRSGSGGNPLFFENGFFMGGTVIRGGSSGMASFTPAWDLENLLDQSDPSRCRTKICNEEWDRWKEFSSLTDDKRAQFLLGEEAFLSEEYRMAVWWLKKSAEQSYTPALIFLGTIFEKGVKDKRGIIRINQNIPLAKWYYEIAANELNDAVAQHSLGMIAFEEGDFRSAARRFSEAARQDFAPSEYYRGRLVLIEGDESLAEEFFLKAARQNVVNAKLALARLYKKQGKIDLAVKWLKEAGSDLSRM